MQQDVCRVLFVSTFFLLHMLPIMFFQLYNNTLLEYLLNIVFTNRSMKRICCLGKVVLYICILSISYVYVILLFSIFFFCQPQC